jgi:hypothetical protein
LCFDQSKRIYADVRPHSLVAADIDQKKMEGKVERSNSNSFQPTGWYQESRRDCLRMFELTQRGGDVSFPLPDVGKPNGPGTEASGASQTFDIKRSGAVPKAD